MSAEHEHIDYEAIGRYLGEEMTTEEQSAFEKLIANDPALAAEVDALRQLWEVPAVEKVPTFNAERGWAKVQQNIQAVPTAKVRKLPIWSYAAAASVAILLGFFWFTQGNQDQWATAVVTAENRVDTLHDGTIIHLKAGAHYWVGEDFGAEKRPIKLEGAAYFEVASDATRPFTIDLGEASIEVLGTEFYAETFQTDSVWLSVDQGKVKFGSKNQQNATQIFTAGESGAFNTQNQAVKKKPLQDASLLFWKDKRLVFRKMKLANVAKILQEHYQVEITFDQPEDAQLQWNATFKGDSIQTIIQTLELTFGLKAEWKSNQVNLHRQ